MYKYITIAIRITVGVWAYTGCHRLTWPTYCSSFLSYSPTKAYLKTISPHGLSWLQTRLTNIFCAQISCVVDTSGNSDKYLVTNIFWQISCVYVVDTSGNSEFWNLEPQLWQFRKLNETLWDKIQTTFYVKNFPSSQNFMWYPRALSLRVSLEYCHWKTPPKLKHKKHLIFLQKSAWYDRQSVIVSGAVSFTLSKWSDIYYTDLTCHMFGIRVDLDWWIKSEIFKMIMLDQTLKKRDFFCHTFLYPYECQICDRKVGFVRNIHDMCTFKWWKDVHNSMFWEPTANVPMSHGVGDE